MIQPKSARPACILAIEAATELVSVALAHADHVEMRRPSAGETAAEAALALTDELLEARGLTARDVDAFAFGSGPGAFTGLRVACALVQGLAFACERPVIAVSSLKALACNAYRAASVADRQQAAGAERPLRILAAVDARMGQAYCALYEGWPLREVLAPTLAAPEDLSRHVVEGEPDVIAGNALRVFADCWGASATPLRLPDIAVDAASVAQLARLDWEEGRWLKPHDAAPDYVRNQVALTVAQRLRS